MLDFHRGRPEDDTNDVVQLLLECHQRIRHFSELARRLGEADGLPEAEIQDAASAVHRYFAQALPLHVADEEQSLLPRLRGREPEVDAALERMAAEHRRHEPLLRKLLATCETLASTPARHEELRVDLLETAEALQREFEAHLAEEERVILPALERHCPPDERAAMADEVRERRRQSYR